MKIEINNVFNSCGYEKVTDKKIEKVLENGFIINTSLGYKIINKKGEDVIDICFEEFDCAGSYIIMYTKDDRVILMDNEFNIIYNTTAKEISFVKDNVFQVDTDNITYLINNQGEKISDNYSSIYFIKGNNSYVACMLGEKRYGIVDLSGKIICPFIYDNIDSFIYDYTSASINNENVVIDTTGKIICNFKKKSVDVIGNDLFSSFINNRRCIYDKDKKNILKIKEKDMNFMFFIKKAWTGDNKIIMTIYDSWLSYYCIYNFLNKKMKRFPILESKQILDRELFIIKNKVIDNKGDKITRDDIKVVGFTPFENLFYIEKDSKIGLADNEKVVVDYIYDDYFKFENINLIGLIEDDILVIYNEKLEKIFNFKCDEFEDIKKIGKYYLVKVNDSNALFSLKGELIVPFSNCNR